MGNITTIIILLAVVTALAQITDKIKVPYPIMLVIAGIGISLIPGLPHITLDAEVVFLLFLPPVLYSAAWIHRSWISEKQRDLFQCLQSAVYSSQQH